MQLSTVVAPLSIAPPPAFAELPVKVLSVTVAVPMLKMAVPSRAELPVNVQRSTVTVPSRLLMPTRELAIVNRENAAVTLMSTWNAPIRLPPLMVTPAAGPVMVVVPAVLVNSNTPSVLLSVIVLGVAKRVGSNEMVCVPAPSVLAYSIASRRLVPVPSDGSEEPLSSSVNVVTMSRSARYL